MWAPHYFFCPPFSCCLIEQKKKDCIALKLLCSDCFGNVGSNNHIMNPIHRLYVLSYLFTCISIYDNSSYIDIFVGFPPLWSAKDCIISSQYTLLWQAQKKILSFASWFINCTPTSQPSNFVDHSKYDYRLNLTTQSPITIINHHVKFLIL